MWFSFLKKFPYRSALCNYQRSFNFEVNGSGPLYLKVVIMTIFCSVEVTCESELENLDAAASLKPLAVLGPC